MFRQCPANHYPYAVQAGDTLVSIAGQLGVDLDRLIAANPDVDPYNLRIGQTLCIPACPPDYTAYIIQPGDTLYRIAQMFGVSIESIVEANPGVDPDYLRVAQRICIPPAGTGTDGGAGDRETIRAMQEDIDMLKQESGVQRTHAANYGMSDQATRALTVTSGQLRFEAAPVAFAGDYRGHYTEGRSYPYYIDASMGGRRSINVQDNFGVWHSFGWQEQNGNG